LFLKPFFPVVFVENTESKWRQDRARTLNFAIGALSRIILKNFLSISPSGKLRLAVLSLVLLCFGFLVGMSTPESESYAFEEGIGERSDTVLVPTYPTDYFQSPLDVPLYLSGSFGELRTNHFHAGLDIKTKQQEGLKVYSVADGYISRIKVSHVGYGYALYVDHPNGYTTVYGHLQKYGDKILEFVKAEQYKQRKFGVDVFPSPTDLPVLKGEVIALSGNSGASGGPHLHFEVRETKSEKVLNPLLFGFEIKDKIRPSVSRVWIVPLSDSTRVNTGTVPLSFETIAAAGGMSLKTTTPPTVYGDVGFAIHTSDLLDGNSNRCGIYRIELFVDGLQVYGQRMDRLDFTTNRAMNAHTIYERFKKDRSQLHGSYRLPGNPLDIYDNLVNDGIVTFNDGKLHELEYRVLDYEENLTVVKFKVQSGKPGKAIAGGTKPSLAFFDWEKDNVYEAEDIRITIPAFSLYENVNLTIDRSKKITGALTPTYLIVSPYEPLHSPYTLAIRADHIKPTLHNKLIIARYDPEKDRIYSEGGNMENGFVIAQPLYLGYFGVLADTVDPSISSIDFSAQMKAKSSFSFKISDWLSGVSEFIPTIDGEWVLMEYDGKNSRLTCYYDSKRMTRGEHQFMLRVIDGVGNEKAYKSKFVW